MPLSEPESKFLFEEMQRFKPDLIVSIHAPYGVLNVGQPGAGANESRQMLPSRCAVPGR